MGEIYSLPIVHPAALLRGQEHLSPLQADYIKRAKEYLDGNYTPVDISSPPSGAIMYPTLEQLERFLARPFPLGASIDIESAGPHIICIGVMCIETEDYICIRFRWHGGFPRGHGTLYWRGYNECLEAVKLVDDFLADPSIAKVFHNGQAFDVIELATIASGEDGPEGFEVRGFTDHPLGLDTMLAQAAAMPGFPKGLQQCATFHLGFPVWKTLVKEKDEAEGK